MCCLWNHHIRALLARNFIYRKRSWISSLIQLLLPCATILILVGIKVSLKDDDYFKPTVIPDFYPSDAIQPLGFLDYLTAVQVPRKCETLTVDLVGGWSEYYKLRKDGIKYLISDINPSRWPVPFVKCDARRCKENGQSAFDLCEYNILAVAPTNEISKEDVVSFEKYVKSTYPMLDDIQQKLGYELVQTQFQSSDEIDQYVQHPEYGKVGRPKVALAIILGRSGKQYQYTLRTNSTNVNSQEIAGRPVQPTQPSTLKLFDDYAKVAKRSCELQGGVRIGAANEDNCVVQYIYNGALTIQRLVNDWIIDDSGAKAAGSFISENGVSFADFPSFEYIRDGFYAQIAPYAPLLIVLGLLFSVSSSIKSIVSEKELRQKELMKMMSISEFAIGCSWFLSTYAFFFIMGILTTICTKFVYAKANFFALLLFWELSYLSIVTLILTVSAIFSKATRASLVGILVFFIGYFFTLIEDIEDGRRGIVLLLSIHPVTATSYGLQMIGLLEDKGVGLRRSSFQFSDFPSRYSFSRCVSMLVFDIFLWGFLSWYLNRVVPGDYGQAEPWYFPCLKSYWCGVKESEWTETSHSDDEVSSDVPKEQVSNALKEQEKDGKGVHIKGLTKMFGDKTAVDNLNLSMYSGQVFVLLGHNGAGKTTTINMLTGMISPTSGNAMIAGKNIKTQLSEARKSVGICLQHDCLFPMLTVKEHVQFFCRVKGVYGSMSYEQAEASVKSAIEDVALLDKKNTYAKNLSGGMKRKLSLAIAFCGDSKVVFLDEPTAGMDPFSRRFTWNVIRQNREDRCIILTTHFMDEADLLGDRIAIMAEGQLRCVGSSIFLKKKYGVGYNITIEKASKKKDDSISDMEQSSIDSELSSLFQTNIPKATLLSNVSAEMKFRLPLDSSNFTTVFDSLDEMVKLGKIDTYGVGVTTLDEVFLMVARGEMGIKHEFESSKNVLESSGGEPVVASNSYRSTENINENKLFATHVRSLFEKRAMNFKRDKKAWICSTVLPGVCALLGFILITFVTPDRNMPAHQLSLNDYNVKFEGKPRRNPIPFNEAESFPCDPGSCIYNFGSSSETFCGNSVTLSSDQCVRSDFSQLDEHFIDYGASAIPQNVSSILDASKSLASNSEAFNLATSQYGAVYITHTAGAKATNGTAYELVAISKCKDSKNEYNDSFDCTMFGGTGYLVSTNFTSMHASIMFQTIADEAFVRDALDDNDIQINTFIHPLPLTDIEEGFAQAEDAFSAWFLLTLSFPFITGTFATFIVQERMIKAKHLQTVAGVKPEAYWLSSFVWDLINYLFPLTLVIILMFAFNVQAFITTERGVLGGTLTSLFFFGPAAAGFTYIVTFLFKSPSACNIFIIVFNFFIGLAGPLTVLILRLFHVRQQLDGNPGSLLGIAIAIEWCLRFFPSFNLSKALFFTINIEIFSIVYFDSDLTVWSKDILLIEVIYLIVQSVLYIWLAIQIDKLSTNPKAVMWWKYFLTCRCLCWWKKGTKGNQSILHQIDEDIQYEIDRVHMGEANGDLIVINDLTKRYPDGKLAVDNLCLGIPSGQCFGLLGINGAGKTTTMAMLTAEFPPTSGDATLEGFSVTSEPEQTRRRIGYCPQFDAHFMNMTGREHVKLYASIKGVPANIIEDVVSYKLQQVGLNEYDSNRLSSNYSGGMKRKLSVACATIGNPRIIFLDEPSTGMDPVSRRDLWGIISAMVVGDGSESSSSSIILTTHSMEECEALCPRIGIMAGGRLKCLGSAQHLKSRYGKGFQVECKIKEIDVNDNDFVNTVTALTGKSRSDTSDIEVASDKSLLKVFTLDAAIAAVETLTGDKYLSQKINTNDPSGYVVYKNAKSTGVSSDELAVFCVDELRMRALLDFFTERFPNCILHERQDAKVRFEIPSEGISISSIFSVIEESKEVLKLSDYGVSQTSLEQVFNMHAAVAEKEKEAKTD